MDAAKLVDRMRQLRSMFSAAIGKYSDIGKATNDLINKDFPVNVIKVEAKGVEKTVSKRTMMTVTR